MKALITGASSGIGRDMAKVLNKKGYEITKIETFTLPKEKSIRNLVVIKRK